MPARLRAIHFSIILARQSQSKAQPLPGRRAKEATLTTKDLIYPRCTDLKLGDTRDGYLGLHSETRVVGSGDDVKINPQFVLYMLLCSIWIIQIGQKVG